MRPAVRAWIGDLFDHDPAAGAISCDALTLTSGTRFSSYEILTPLGAGGMGEVYRATDTKLGRHVAIKILPEAFALDTTDSRASSAKPGRWPR